MADEKKFYWLKLKRDFFKRHDIRIIEAMPNGKDYVLFYLKLLVESVDHEGNLRFSDEIPYNEEMLSVITNTNVDIVRNAIKIFTQLNMMEILDDGTYFMNEVDRMIGSASDNDNANRQRRFREKQKALKNEQMLQECYDSVTKNNESIENRDKRKSIDIEKENILKEKIKEIVSYLNEKTSKHYLCKGSTYEIVKARLNDGYTVENCKYVIDVKCSQWLHFDMEKYLRPETLFNRTKFESYLNEKLKEGIKNNPIDLPNGGFDEL